MAKETKERVVVYIDGSNLYYKLKSKELSIHHTKHFDYRGLAVYLARNRQVCSYRYYVGVVRAQEDDQHGQLLRQGQQQLFSHLEKQGFLIQKGFLMRQGSQYKEKGVDVRLAVDMVVGAYENLYDTAIVVSSDTDLIPAMQKVKSRGKRIEYIGFSFQPSLGIQKYATESRLLTGEDLEPYIVKTWV